MNITLDNQSSIKINGSKIIYFDPYMLKDNYMDADYIFISHPHYDHFSKEDILKIKKDNTKIISVKDNLEDIKLLGFNADDILIVEVDKDYEIDNIKFSTISAYNVNKNFHKKEYGWVGYLVNIDNNTIYFMGDSDRTIEASKIKCDVLCIPIGGTYTMDYKDAIILTKEINPKRVIPMHYKTIVGSYEDALNFKNGLEGFNVDILMK